MNNGKMPESSSKQTKTCVIHVFVRSRVSAEALPSRDLEACLEEAVGLAQAINLNVCYQQIIQINRVISSTLMGKGNVEHIASVIAAEDITLAVVDANLTPIQQRNLEKAWKCKVIDRTGLILEIFGERARTAEGVLQVELAALSYQRSRLVRSWTHLERQRGGFGFIGGPGESQLELDRRLIDDRITKIKKQLSQATRTRELHRKSRQDVPYPIVALAGYTNAGKSTLFNYLTHSDVFAENLLFATLDPTMRQTRLFSGQQVILSDTVGFISNLPTQLVAAFRATLEEVCSADLILHVRDAAHPDSGHQAADVERILCELGLEDMLHDGSVINVYNKMDLLPNDEAAGLKTQMTTQCVGISAITGEGIDRLLQLVDRQLNRNAILMDVVLPSENGELLAWLYRKGAVLARSDKDDGVYLNLRLKAEDLEKFNYMKGQ